jgi:hypothetical protein
MKLSPSVFLLLAACGTAMQPGDPAVTARIVAACTESGLFKIADGLAAAAVPAAALPVAVVNAGVDRVCADPAAFSADISTVEWVVKNTVNRKP